MTDVRAVIVNEHVPKQDEVEHCVAYLARRPQVALEHQLEQIRKALCAFVEFDPPPRKLDQRRQIAGRRFGVVVFDEMSPQRRFFVPCPETHNVNEEPLETSDCEHYDAIREYLQQTDIGR